MSNLNNTPVSPIRKDLTVRIICEGNDQSQDYLDADGDMRYMSDTRTRHHQLANASLKEKFDGLLPQSAESVVTFYQNRYPWVQATAPAPYSARQAERDILDAGVPYNYVRSMTKAGFTRESVEAGIKAYFALKAMQYEKNAAKLALVLSR